MHRVKNSYTKRKNTHRHSCYLALYLAIFCIWTENCLRSFFNCKGLPRTNNSIEGWHNSINNLFSCQHPKIFTFLDKIIKEQNDQDMKIIQAKAGDKGRKKHIKYERNDQRILTLIESYEKETEHGYYHYLYALAYSISVWKFLFFLIVCIDYLFFLIFAKYFCLLYLLHIAYHLNDSQRNMIKN